MKGFCCQSADDEEWTLPDNELEEDQKYIIRVKQNKENLFGHISGENNQVLYRASDRMREKTQNYAGKTCQIMRKFITIMRGKMQHKFNL